jgi:hypothetical protein
MVDSVDSAVGWKCFILSEQQRLEACEGTQSSALCCGRDLVALL